MRFFSSSTTEVPIPSIVPQHVAIVMDGNGRWAKARFLPRIAGHKKGVDALKRTVQACCDFGIQHLTVFAFSSENWRRPPDEVSFLMRLFVRVLRKEVQDMHTEGIRLRVIGDISVFDVELQAAIHMAQDLTKGNTRLTLNVAANYGGRWDILQAMRTMLQTRSELKENPHLIQESDISPYLCLSDSPEPDLFIRTGGEQRVSNFLLWQLAYTEFYFTNDFWPDFGKHLLTQAIESYNQRERRFGRTSEQVCVPSLDVRRIS